MGFDKYFKENDRELAHGYQHKSAKKAWDFQQEKLDQSKDKIAELKTSLELEELKNANQFEILEYFQENCPDEYSWVLENYKN